MQLFAVLDCGGACRKLVQVCEEDMGGCLPLVMGARRRGSDGKPSRRCSLISCVRVSMLLMLVTGVLALVLALNHPSTQVLAQSTERTLRACVFASSAYVPVNEACSICSQRFLIINRLCRLTLGHPSVQAMVHRGMNQVGAIFQAQKLADTGSSVGLRGSQQLQQAANAAVTAGSGS